jgi:hypothetical protein
VLMVVPIFCPLVLTDGVVAAGAGGGATRSAGLSSCLGASAAGGGAVCTTLALLTALPLEGMALMLMMRS